MTPCDQLVDAPSTERSERAFECWVLPEIDVLYRVALSLTRNRYDAEDLVQETLARAHSALDRFDGRHPRAWLLTILRNTHVNSVRRRRPDLLRDPDATLDDLTIHSTTSARAAAEGDPAEVLDAAGFDAAVEAALDDLSDDFRSVVGLVDIGGMSYQEAADALDIPVGTVMSRLHRARKRMLRSLESSRDAQFPIPTRH
ncbi:MAG: sigma-70 family RNA polymerase sigma factor [Acidimicrobiia bacterium]|nr:sigma-70 family RNA polymerase sigma factor [Acidimicrobiia bacterium]